MFLQYFALPWVNFICHPKHQDQFGSHPCTHYSLNCSISSLNTATQQIINHLSSIGDSPHSVDGRLKAIFTKIKQKNSIFLPPLSAMIVPKQDLIWQHCFNFFFQTPPIPFIFTAIIKLIISSKNMPLVCQNSIYWLRNSRLKFWKN